MAKEFDVDRSPNPVDLHVGLRIRLRRKELGVSQEKLADLYCHRMATSMWLSRQKKS